MKKIQKSLLVLLAVAAVLPACKKGAEDPGMPFSSRKKRVEGTWTITELKTVGSNNDNSFNCGGNVVGTNKSTWTETITATSYDKTSANTVTCGATSVITNNTLKGTVSKYTMTFDKAGTWTAEMNYVTTETVDNNANQQNVPAGAIDKDDTENTYTIKSSGVWNFLGKIQEDTKNKEEISVSTLSKEWTVSTKNVNTYKQDASAPTVSTTTNSSSTGKDTYQSNENVSIWKLVRLAKKEMKVIRSDKGTSTGSNTFPSGNTTVTTTSNTDDSSETTMTWVQ